jgi:transcription initiation factor TFIIIB Brf1 subunit/transcription initiation factor TFIIB
VINNIDKNKLFKYYRYALSVENVMNSKVVDPNSTKSRINKYKTAWSIFSASNAKNFTIDDIPPVIIRSDFDQFMAEVSFMEKITNLKQKNYNRRPYVKPDKDASNIENCNDFVSPDESPYQYCLILNFGKKNQNEIMYFPLAAIMPEFTSKCEKSLVGDERFERLRSIMEPDYVPTFDDDLEFWPNKFIINPAIETIADVNKEIYSRETLSVQSPDLIVTEAFAEELIQGLLDDKLILTGAYYGAISQNFNMGLNRFYDTVLKQGLNDTLKEFFSIHPSKEGGVKGGTIGEDDIMTTGKMAKSFFKHYGSFDTKNSMMESQRQAMACYLQDDKRVVPVNGAPGTGKTALLRAISGDYIVKQAMSSYANFKKTGEISFATPIVCSSTNNQALYNITEGIESGFKDAAGNGVMYRRWIIGEYRPVLKQSTEGNVVPENEPECDVIDLSKTIYAPVLKTRQENYFVITKQKINEVVNKTASIESAEYYLQQFQDHFGVEPQGKSQKGKINFCADFLFDKISLNVKHISSSLLSEKFFDNLSNSEKAVTKLMPDRSMDKIKGFFSSLKNTDTKTIEVFKTIESTKKDSQKQVGQKSSEVDVLREQESNHELIIMQSVKESTRLKQSIDDLLKLKNQPQDSNNFESLLASVLHAAKEAIYKEESTFVIEQKEKIIREGGLIEKAKYIVGFGSMHEAISLLQSNLHPTVEKRLDAKRDDIRKVVITQIEEQIETDLELSTSKYFDIENALEELRANKQKIASNIDLRLEEIRIIEKNRDAYVSAHDSFMARNGITGAPLKKEADSMFDNLFIMQEYERLKDEKKGLDTKERSENFYLALHLLESLFFLENCQFIDEEKSERDMCPACEIDSFVRDEDNGKYKCTNCGAYFANTLTGEVSEQTAKWFSHIFRKKKALIQSSGAMYVVKINKQKNMSYVNIEKKERGTSELWHSILPIFPIISMTCNGMGNIISEKKASGETVPPADLFDFMLIDEAGTITASKMIILSAAKRVMLFGDVKQLKPVFAYTVDFEHRVLERFFDDQKERNAVVDYFSCADDVSSNQGEDDTPERSSNAMDIANQSALFFMPYNNSKLEGDIWLKEHFRCRKSIVEISNTLTYFGEVLPQKKNKEWQHLYFVEVAGEKGKDNTNRDEVRAVINYLINQKDYFKSILAKSKDTDQAISDEDYYRAVGIITPFANQHRLFEKAITSFAEAKDAALTHVTVGTVHKYQGSEREIIIFSTVYGKADAPRSKNFFFNRRDTDMINVAVTRAKEIFVCFGSREALDVDGTHSSVMVREITVHEKKFIIS